MQPLRGVLADATGACCWRCCCDGIAPQLSHKLCCASPPAAHLEGALQLTLDGCYHSPLGAAEGRGLESVEASSGECVERWLMC